MKQLILLAMLTGLVTGCTMVYLPNGETYKTTGLRHIVVNNTGYALDVSVDGKPLTTLQTGQTIGLPFTWLVPDQQVVVVAHDHGQYIGCSTMEFHASRAYTWQINSVDRPQVSQ
jgi:hypothetical protein